MKYQKPNGMVLDVHEDSVPYVQSLGWHLYVEPVKKKKTKKKAKK